MSSTLTRYYDKFEFCIAVNCPELSEDHESCLVDSNEKCVKTAKQFHKWSADNQFIILQVVDEDE